MGMDTYKSFVLNSPNTYKDDSAYNKQKNRALYQKYVKNYLAEQQMDEQLAQIKKSKESALSESAIATERARQYVDAVNKHYGIAGTGYAESKAIDLFSQEAKRRAEINNAHSAQENEALKAYKQAIANAELAENEALGNIELAEDEANEAKRQEYVMKLQELADNPDVSKEDFTKYYEAYEGYLGEGDTVLKNDLESKAKEYADAETFAQNKEAVINELAQKGVKPVDPITLEALEKDRNVFGKFNNDSGEQAKHIDAIIKLARKELKDGTSVLDGKAFDVNFGSGKDYYYYKDGVFYNISKKEAEKIGITEIDAQGNIVDKTESASMSDYEVNRYRKMRMEKHN